MAVDLSATFLASPQETFSNADGARSPTITFDAFNTRVRLNATTTPAITKNICKTIALAGGAYTIDLTTELMANGVAVAGTGLKVRFIRITNLGANTMTFSEGASNGYALPGLPKAIATGGVYMEYFADGAPAVASGDRTIDVAGTGTQEFELTIELG